MNKSKHGPTARAVLYLSLLVGIVFFLVGLKATYETSHMKRTFQQTICHISDKKMDIISATNPGDTTATLYYVPTFFLIYNANNQTYRVWKTESRFERHTINKIRKTMLLDRYTTGKSYLCWYDPKNPEDVALVPDNYGKSLVFFLGSLFFLLITCIIRRF